jgi:hypothetical protein
MLPAQLPSPAGRKPSHWVGGLGATSIGSESSMAKHEPGQGPRRCAALAAFPTGVFLGSPSSVMAPSTEICRRSRRQVYSPSRLKGFPSVGIAGRRTAALFPIRQADVKAAKVQPQFTDAFKPTDAVIVPTLTPSYQICQDSLRASGSRRRVRRGSSPSICRTHPWPAAWGFLTLTQLGDRPGR